MLILDRRPGERVLIGNDGYVEVRSVTPNKVILRSRYAGGEQVSPRYAFSDVVLGPDVWVRVLSIRRDLSVRLGIQAPAEVPIDRLEARERKLREGEAGRREAAHG